MIDRTEAWFTEPAIAILEPMRFHTAFEYGSGASTLWFADRCDHLYSVDDNKEWHEAVCAKTAHILGVYPMLKERPYYNVIHDLPHELFDLIIVDGRDRSNCIKASIDLLRSGGILVLDNSEREYYERGIALMDGWNRIHCQQHRPDKYDFNYPGWQTTIFFKP